ncbi:MAG: regulatory protein RecX [Halioglobus sp.]
MTDLDADILDGDDGPEEAALAINPVDIRFAAMNLLARREHTQRELRRKLGRRFANAQLVAQEVQRLTDEHLQSDQRFAESFAWQRTGRGYGPQRVRQEMRDRGLADHEIADALAVLEVDWRALAYEVYHKKFGSCSAAELKEKARRARFMQYRGFSAEHYQHLIET